MTTGQFRKRKITPNAEKIASLPWCDGNIAGLGISYYAIIQWAVAAQRPPHLKAIIPFEGACDLYREFARHGGIGSDFVNAWYPLQVAANDPHGVIATGWLRASHRKMDKEKSLPYRPYHTHDELQPLKKGEKAQMNIEIWPTSIIIPKGYRLGGNIGGRDYRFTAPNLKSKVDISHYLKNPKLIIGMFRALPLKQLFKIFTHEKAWAGNAMYTHNMDMKRKEFSGTTTVYSEAGNRPYLLLPVIPGKKA